MPSSDAPRVFTGIGGTYEKAGTLLSFGQDPRWRERLVSRVAAAPGDIVLDVATGTGLVARALCERYRCRVVGLDQSADMLSAAAARNGHIPLVRGRAERLPFPVKTRGASEEGICPPTMRGRRRADPRPAECASPSDRVFRTRCRPAAPERG